MNNVANACESSGKTHAKTNMALSVLNWDYVIALRGNQNRKHSHVVNHVIKHHLFFQYRVSYLMASLNPRNKRSNYLQVRTDFLKQFELCEYFNNS